MTSPLSTGTLTPFWHKMAITIVSGILKNIYYTNFLASINNFLICHIDDINCQSLSTTVTCQPRHHTKSPTWRQASSKILTLAPLPIRTLTLTLISLPCIFNEIWKNGEKVPTSPLFYLLATPVGNVLTLYIWVHVPPEKIQIIQLCYFHLSPDFLFCFYIFRQFLANSFNSIPFC